MKIVVRATNWIGDAVMSLPGLRAIRSAFPDAEIAVLAKPWVAALYEREPCIDRIIHLNGFWPTVAQLRRQRFDLGILFPNSFASAAMMFLGGVRRRFGYARDGRSFLLSKAVAVPCADEVPRHERFYYLELLKRLQIIDNIDVADADGFVFSGAGAALFETRGIRLPVIGVSPGAAFGSAKRWLPERFAEAAVRLTHGHCSIAVFGSDAERELCQQVADACGGYNLAGATTLRQFIDMTAACELFLTNDSGAMHIASLVGVPSVTVFGPTDEMATGPTGANAVVVRQHVECSPCKLRECPIDHRCMTRVTVDQVVQAAGVRLRGCRKQ